MAQAVRDIRRRIKAIRSTQQITRAMQMVATAKLRKAQTRAVSARAYAAKLTELLGRLTTDGAHAGHPLLETRPVRKVSILLVTADRGLAGSYSTNLLRRAEAAQAELRRGPDPVAVELLVVGRKGRDYFRRRGVAIAREDLAVPDDRLSHLSREFSVRLIDRFTRGETDAVVIIYSKFISTMQQKAVEVRLLPVAKPEPPGDAGAEVGEARLALEAAAADFRYIYEPNARSVYSLLLPKFVTNQLFQALLEARASEYAARMTAMAAATNNADDLIGQLTRKMNHARQASITQEIMELVSGAEALKEK